MPITANVLSLVGNTPMLRLERVARGVEAEVDVKLEYLNPSGSIKDRIALRMIEDAEREGKLRPGMEIIEASTGNTATALAFVGAVKGYKVRLFLPSRAASEERLRIMKAYGAEVVFIDDAAGKDSDAAGGGLHGSVVEKSPRQRCLELERENPDRIWWARQFSSPGNAGAHEDGTGREILEQTGGQVDAFVAAIGTCGTIVGVGRALRKRNPSVRLVAVEPRGTPAIKDGKLAKAIQDPEVEGGLLEVMVREGTAREVLRVEQAEAIEMAYRLCEEEGLFCGLSSGANVVAALRVARELKRGQHVVTLLVDSRDRYLFKEQLTT